MVTREDVMVYSAMIGAFSILASGFCFDIARAGLGLAFAVIGLISAVALMISYLHYSPPTAKNRVEG
jgi:hypothetical protein